jgi:hypothetical protein
LAVKGNSYVGYLFQKKAVALLVSPLSYSAGNRNFSHPRENHRREKNFVGKDHAANKDIVPEHSTLTGGQGVALGMSGDLKEGFIEEAKIWKTD